MLTDDEIISSSLQLCQLSADKMPVGIASGCLVECGNRRLLLSVQHATGNQGNWAIQLEYDQSHNATKLYQIGAMNFIDKLTIPDGKIETLDFAYAAVPNDLVAYRHFVTLIGETTAKHEVVVYPGPFDATPSLTDSYSFSGAVLPSTYGNVFNASRPIFDCELLGYRGLSFVRTEGDFHVFKLPFSHPGHIYFKGCSGAPILDSLGRPVALVTSGRDDSDEILGIALDRLMTIVGITL